MTTTPSWPPRSRPSTPPGTAACARSSTPRRCSAVATSTSWPGARSRPASRSSPAPASTPTTTLPHYFENRSEDQIADMFVEDIETGIQGSELKAAFLKCAADEPGVNENIEKVHRASARASVRTGAPIMAHSRPASNTGPRQVEIFLEEGVDPAKIQIAHTGDSDDLDYIEGLLETGVWIGLDRYGLDLYLPYEKRNATTAELLRRGHADRIFLSQDHCATIDWFPPEAVEGLIAQGLVRDWSMTLVFDQVLPWLREQGVWDDAAYTTVFEDNPRRWLAGP